MDRSIRMGRPKWGRMSSMTGPGSSLTIALMGQVEASEEQKRRTIQVPLWLSAAGAWGWRWLVLLASLFTVLWVARELRVAVLPVVLAILISTLLVPIAHGLRKLHLPRALAGGLSVLLAVAFLGGAFTLLGVSVAGELSALGAALEKGYFEFVSWMGGLAGVPAEEVKSWVESHLDTLRSSAGSIMREAVSRMRGVFEALTMLVLTLVFTWFFTWDGDEQFSKAVDLLPEERRKPAAELGRRIWSTVGSYMRGMFVIATADAILLAIGLWIIQMPLKIPLALLMFLGALVPFLGPVIAATASGFVGLAHGGLTLALLAVLVCFVVQQIEGNLLHPFIMGRAVSLHPALILFVVTSGAIIAGVVGIFLAVPVAAALSTALGFARERKVL